MNGIVYEFFCHTTEERYIGASIMPTHMILSSHLYQYNFYKRGFRSHRPIFDIIERCNYELRVIDTAPRNQLLKLKDYYIKLYKIPENKISKVFTPSNYPVNKYTEMKKIWYNANKDRLNKNMKEYYAINKFEISEKNKNKRIAKKLAKIIPN
jgi:hypothetical protein